MERNDTNKCNCQMFGTTSLLSRTQKLNENKDKEKKTSSTTTNTTKETTKETTTTFCTVLYFEH